MSDTSWRISGGLGVPGTPAQVLTQGIGFPLRPVDGVPPQDSGEELEGIPIAEGMFMQWMGGYQSGLVYPTGSVVTDEGWQMIANTPTVTKPAPTPVGAPTYGLPSPSFSTQADLSVVYSGHLYTFTQSGWVRELRIWVVDDAPAYNYRVIIVDVTDPASPVTTVIEEPVISVGTWTTVGFSQQMVLAGTKLLIYVDALNSGTATPKDGGWRCGGLVNLGAPAYAGWNYRGAQDIIRINNFDLDDVDRGTELMGFDVSTSIHFAEVDDSNYAVTYTVAAVPVDQGAYVEYNVRMESTGPLGVPRTSSVTNMSALIPAPQSTQYVEQVGAAPAPAWATTEGFLQFNGADQGGSGNAYGVDLEFDEAVINPDWDIMSFAST